MALVPSPPHSAIRSHWATSRSCRHLRLAMLTCIQVISCACDSNGMPSAPASNPTKNLSIWLMSGVGLSAKPTLSRSRASNRPPSGCRASTSATISEYGYQRWLQQGITDYSLDCTATRLGCVCRRWYQPATATQTMRFHWVMWALNEQQDLQSRTLVLRPAWNYPARVRTARVPSRRDEFLERRGHQRHSCARRVSAGAGHPAGGAYAIVLRRAAPVDARRRRRRLCRALLLLAFQRAERAASIQAGPGAGRATRGPG